MDDSPGSLDFSLLAPSGYYIALRIGFAFPIAERNALPPEWVQHYTRQGFMLHDPVIRWLYANTGATRWSAIATADPHGIMEQARRYGLCYGAAISLRDPRDPGVRSFGSFARADREYSDGELAALAAELAALHAAFAPPENLTNAELEALALVKSGLLMKQIAARLGVSEGAVKQRLRNAKLKLGAKTASQAAAKASDFGLI
jgi:LuxR family transcriptional regulator